MNERIEGSYVKRNEKKKKNEIQKKKRNEVRTRRFRRN